MAQVRDMIFALCMCAVLGAGVRILSPGKMQREMRLICTLMMILCMAARLSDGFSFDIEGMLSGSTGAERSEQYAEYILTDTEQALKEVLDRRLSELGLSAETGIICDYDEYNYVRAEKVYIRLGEQSSAEDAAAAEQAAEELFPDAEREVTAGE